MLEVRSAVKRFHPSRPDERIALDGLELTLGAGEFAVVIGANGSGKSSLLNAVAGALVLDAGQVLVAGRDVTGQPVHRRAAWLARVFQDPMRGTAATMTVAENMLLADLRGRTPGLRFALSGARRTRYAERLAILGLGLEDRLDSRVDLLSGGQRQALSLAMAVSNSPAVLLLDEHTAALDPRTAELVMQATLRAVRGLGLTTLMVTHDMRHAVDFGDRVVMLDAGRVKLQIAGARRQGLAVADLVRLFATPTDSLLLAA